MALCGKVRESLAEPCWREVHPLEVYSIASLLVYSLLLDGWCNVMWQASLILLMPRNPCYDGLYALWNCKPKISPFLLKLLLSGYHSIRDITNTLIWIVILTVFKSVGVSTVSIPSLSSQTENLHSLGCYKPPFSLPRSWWTPFYLLPLWRKLFRYFKHQNLLPCVWGLCHSAWPQGPSMSQHGSGMCPYLRHNRSTFTVIQPGSNLPKT